MRKSFVIVGFLLGSACSIYGQKYRMGQAPKPANPAEFPLHLHISASHLRRVCSGDDSGGSRLANVSCTSNGLFVDAVLNGRKVELWGDSKIGKLQSAVLAPGDYTAQLANDGHNTDQTVISQDYKVLLHDGTSWLCHLSGIVE
jgi:hypothetical protein